MPKISTSSTQIWYRINSVAHLTPNTLYSEKPHLQSLIGTKSTQPAVLWSIKPQLGRCLTIIRWSFIIHLSLGSPLFSERLNHE